MVYRPLPAICKDRGQWTLDYAKQVISLRLPLAIMDEALINHMVDKLLHLLPLFLIPPDDP